LKNPDDHCAQSEERYRVRQEYHPTISRFNSVIEIFYLSVLALGAYGLCCVGVWITWRQWRQFGVALRGIISSLPFYLAACGIIWHGFSVAQKYFLTSPNSCDTLIAADREAPMANILEREKQIVAIGALAESSSICSIERMTGIHRDTIMRLGLRVGRGCANLLDKKMRGLSCLHLEFDEIWGFIRKKQKHVRPGDDPSYGDIWTFCAIDADTKLVPAFKVGKRDVATANAFVNDVASRLKNRV